MILEGEPNRTISPTNFVHNLVSMLTTFLHLLAAPTCKQFSDNNFVQKIDMITNKLSYCSQEPEHLDNISHVIKSHV